MVAVYECYSRTIAKGIKLHEHHLEEHARHNFNKAIIGNGIREFSPELSLYSVEVIIIESAICSKMIAYKNSHDLTFGEFAFTVSITFIFNGMRRKEKVVFKFGIQIFVEFIYNTEYFSNFVFGKISLAL
jgi:hypothetical protein